MNIHASPQVIALIGRDQLERLRGERFRRFNCCACGRPGRTDDEPATVIVQHRQGTNRIRFAHARCAGSQVIEAGQEAPDIFILGGILSKAAVLEYASQPRVRPLLILEPKTELSQRTASGEAVNLYLSGLLDRGFTLMGTSGALPDPGAGWLLQAGPCAFRLLAPGDVVAFQGGLDPPQTWLDLVQNSNLCVVLIGTIGLNARREMTVQELRRLLNLTARAGELAGAVVRTQVQPNLT